MVRERWVNVRRGDYYASFSRSSAGYAIADLEVSPLNPLVKGLDETDEVGPFVIRNGPEDQRVAPLEVDDLHRQFAAIATASNPQDAVVRFATRFGNLGRWLVPLKGGSKSPLVWGVSLTRWRREAAAAAPVVTWLDAARSYGQASRFVHFQKRDDFRSIAILHRPGDALEARLLTDGAKAPGGISPETFSELWSDQVTGAREALRLAALLTVNDNLRGHCSPVLFGYPRPRSLWCPHDLAAAIWMAASFELTGPPVRPSTCFCGKPLPEDSTRRRQFCSDGCRKTWSRRR